MAYKSKSTGKQYKNVYTILEKVKKGEIKSYYNNEEGGLFGKINFYKKPDLVKPYLHYIDSNRLTDIVNAHLSDSETVSKMYQSAYDRNPSPPSFEEFRRKFYEMHRSFPKHLQDDIFKMYYNKMDNIDFETRTDKNYSKFKLLEKSNNPVGKIMSEASSLKSAIFTRNIISYYVTRLTMASLVDAQKAEDVKNMMDDGTEFSNGDTDKMVKEMFDNKGSEKMMEQTLKEATEMCQKLDETLDSEQQKEFFENSSEASKLNGNYFNELTHRIQNIQMSMSKLKDKIKNLLDRSVSYFSARKETIYEDLFNSDNMANLDEFELLHPKLRKIFAEDLVVKDTKMVGKIDVYIDVSGSMSSSAGMDRISKIDFAKSLTVKLLELDMLNDVYLFNNRVKKHKNDIISIAMIDSDGGTDIDAVIKNIEKNNRNALIITDAEDRCCIYSEYAFFIGVKGSDFSHFNPKIIEQYSEKGQAVVFDGNTIKNVNKQGRAVGG